MNAGDPTLSGNQVDLSLFVGDDWRVRPNFTLSGGLRYEMQPNIHDWVDFAPRIGIAWAPGASGSARPKTVIRAGFGLFYDRFALGEHAHCDALRWIGSTAVRGHKPRLLAGNSASLYPGGLPDNENRQTGQSCATCALHHAVGSRPGTAAALQYHAGSHLREFPRAAHAVLPGQQCLRTGQQRVSDGQAGT
jgi:hypothetical protein